MKNYLSLLLCVFGLLLLAGCRTTPYTPPQRPTAGMYPTLLPASELRHFTPVQVNAEELEAHLTELHFWDPLMASQLQQTELSLVVRSLARRGYAELDARRCNCSVHWVIFMGYPAGELTIVGEVANQQLLRKSWSVSPVKVPPAP